MYLLIFGVFLLAVAFSKTSLGRRVFPFFGSRFLVMIAILNVVSGVALYFDGFWPFLFFGIIFAMISVVFARRALDKEMAANDL